MIGKQAHLICLLIILTLKIITMELYSNCCDAAPWLGDVMHERCGECKENCSFEYHMPYLTEDEEQTLIIPYQP